MKKKDGYLVTEFADYGRILSCIGKDDLGTTLESRSEEGRSGRVDRCPNLEQLDRQSPNVHLRRRKYASHI